MTTGRTPEDAKLMVKADGIDVADIEEVGRAQIRRQILLFDLEANLLGRLVYVGNVVDKHGKAVSVRIHAGDGGPEVRSKSGDAGFPRQMVANESNRSNF